MSSKDVIEGEVLTVITVMGRDERVISRLPDGRAILFSRYSPHSNLIEPSQEVDCRVVRGAPNYIIVEPVGEPSPIAEEPGEGEPPEPLDSSTLDELELIGKGYDTNGTFARALLHIIRRLHSGV